MQQTMAPTLRFFGASGSVTGSCFMVEHDKTKLLVDCGMFQGSKTERELNYRPFPFAVGEIEAVILTHGHIDHSGLLPKLYKAGYDGPVYATPPTIDLCGVMLPDSGHIQESEVEQLNRRNRHRGRDPVEPIYTAKDATESLTLFRSVELDSWQSVVPGIRFRFWNAGHMLGSTSVELELTVGGAARRILFSGDIGPGHKLLQYDPTGPSDVDWLVCESTYGDTDREDSTIEGRRKALRQIVLDARHPNGALLIPSFAVERTQELIADLQWLFEKGEVPPCPVVIDSPLAMKASRIFLDHASELEEGALLSRGMRAREIRFTETAEQSKALDLMKGFHIVIAASGMCDAGRIRHRLKNWLWRDEGTVLLVGYQAEGSLGRILKDGAPVVKIQGEEIKVRATIRSLDLYSGHADGPELAAWVKARMPVRNAVFLVHGETEALAGMKARLGEFIDPSRIYIPHLDSVFALETAEAKDMSDLAPPPRIEMTQTGRRDWHNDYQALMLDLQEQLKQAADDRTRAAVIRRIRRALME